MKKFTGQLNFETLTVSDFKRKLFFKQTESETRSVLFSYLFNFYSYCLLIPFWVRFDESSGQYYLKTHRLHKVICGCFHIFLLFAQLSFVISRNFTFTLNSSKLSGIFDFVMNTSSLGLAIFSLKMLWLNQGKVLQVLECTRTTLTHPKMVKVALMFILIFTTLWKFLLEIVVGGGIVRFVDLNQEMEQCYDREWQCASNFEMYQNTRNQTYAQILANLMSRVKILATANIGGYFVFNHLTFLLLGSTMIAVGRELKEELLLHGKNEVWKGINLYRSLKIRVKTLNRIFGSQLLLMYIIALTYFTVATDIVMGFKKKSGLDYIMHYTYLFINLITWIVCADYYSVVQDVYSEWLDHHIFDNPKLSSFPVDVQTKLGAIKKELDQGSVALSCKFFAISNGFLGQMLGVIVTYGIVIFQMQPVSRPP